MGMRQPVGFPLQFKENNKETNKRKKKTVCDKQRGQWRSICGSFLLIKEEGIIRSFAFSFQWLKERESDLEKEGCG
jgi:hypothetical protein